MDYTIHSSGFPLLQKFHLLFFQISFITIIASADKGRHARRTFWHAAGCVIVLDLHRQACVLCLAIDAPERPTGLRVFPEHKRGLARQTRQAGEDNTTGRRLEPGKPCVPLSTDVKPALKRRRTYGYPKHPPAERFFRRTACQCPGWAENHPVFFFDHHCRNGIGKRGRLCSEPADCQNRGLRKHGRPLCPDHRPDAAAPCPGWFSHVPDAGVPRHHAPHCPGTVRFPQRDAAGL